MFEIKEHGRVHRLSLLESSDFHLRRSLSNAGIYEWQLGDEGTRWIDVSELGKVVTRTESGVLQEIHLEGGRLEAEGAGYRLAEPESASFSLLEVNRQIHCWYHNRPVFALSGLVLSKSLTTTGVSNLLRGFACAGELLDEWQPDRDLPVLLYCLVWMDYGSHFRRD